jgi:hypothetical protein
MVPRWEMNDEEEDENASLRLEKLALGPPSVIRRNRSVIARHVTWSTTKVTGWTIMAR